jgi:hypothetical protein
MAIIVVPSLLFLLLAIAGGRFSRENRFKNVTAEDRALLVTAAELIPGADPKREYVRKTEEDDGSLRLTYRYPEEVMPQEPVSIDCIVVRALDGVAAARALQNVAYEVAKQLDSKPELLEWGDESRAGVVLHDGRPVGTFLAARRGRFVWVLRVTGQQLDSAQVQTWVRPRLEQLERFGEPLLGGDR